MRFHFYLIFAITCFQRTNAIVPYTLVLHSRIRISTFRVHWLFLEPRVIIIFEIISIALDRRQMDPIILFYQYTWRNNTWDGFDHHENSSFILLLSHLGPHHNQMIHSLITHWADIFLDTEKGSEYTLVKRTGCTPVLMRFAFSTLGYNSEIPIWSLVKSYGYTTLKTTQQWETLENN